MSIYKFNTSFWLCRKTWKQAAFNTTRCLVGCSIGDLSAMYVLQSQFPSLPVSVSMGVAMASGIGTSITLETFALNKLNGMEWRKAFQTARTMSLLSMLSMEASENVVGLILTGGDMGELSLPIMVVSMGAGWLTPLPYNYYQLKKYGKSCH